MKVAVDINRCESHGQCALVAPEVFRLDDELTLHYDEEPSDGLRELVEEAVLICPTQAIEIVG